VLTLVLVAVAFVAGGVVGVGAVLVCALGWAIRQDSDADAEWFA
jgi:uncharacterized membrane protein YczE